MRSDNEQPLYSLSHDKVCKRIVELEYGYRFYFY